MDRSAELEHHWAVRAQLPGVSGADHLVGTVLAAAYGMEAQKSLTRVGEVAGVQAHRGALSLHVSLDRLIDEVLSDSAADLRAFDAPREVVTEIAPDQVSWSAREQRDDVPRSRESPDLEPGTF